MIDQFLLLLTPAAIATAIVSGVAMALVLHALRPAISIGTVGFLAVVIAVLWYLPQTVQAWADSPDDMLWVRTVSRLAQFMACFVLPMLLVLRRLQRR